jgi:hypothetical protein
VRRRAQNNEKCQKINNKGESMSYVTERFEAAVRDLVTDGPVKERLMRAYSAHLDGLNPIDLPTKVASVYAELNAAVHRVAPSGTATPIKASVQKMSPAEAAQYAQCVVKIYAELLRHGDRAETLKVVDSREPPVPAYLANGS